MNKMFQGLRGYLVKVIRVLLSYIIPVKKGKIMFESIPDYSDNSRAFSDYLIQHSNYRLIWSVNNPSNYQTTDRIRFIEKNGGKSLRGRLAFIYHTVSSQYLFSTHRSFIYANRRKQKYIVLWHGMPLKKIAIMQNADNRNYLNNSSYILCTSKYYVSIFQKCFAKPINEILPIGIPRNDLLFQENDVLDKLGIKKTCGEKLIVYLPTFRKTSQYDKGDSEIDVFSNGLLDLTNDDSLEKLNVYLSSLKTILLVKPHPADVSQIVFKKLSNMVIVPHSVFAYKDIQLNHVLHYADTLLTDFSGVFIDYLNLNRPIGFLLSDFKEYTSNRGFLFEEPLDYMPGEKIFNEKDFFEFCEGVSKGYDSSANERIRLRSVYNDYTDDKNCQRLADYLGLTIY